MQLLRRISPPAPDADRAARVLLLTLSGGLGGGIERYLTTVEETLRAGGAELTRVDMLEPGVEATPGNRARFVRRALSTARRFGTADSVVVGHANLIPVGAAALRLTRARFGPVLFYGTDIWSMRAADRALLRADPLLHPVTISSYSAGALSTVGVAPILPPGISPAWRTTLLGESSRRRPLPPVPTMLSVFRLADWSGKGAAVLLAALATIRAELGPVRLVLAGQGPAPGALHELVSAHPDTEVVESPADEELARLYATADLFVLCTRTHTPTRGRPASGEGYGIVLLEAQLAGCAVVGPASGGSHDAYQDGVTGQTPVDESAAALTEILRGMLADRARLARTGRRAAEWAEAATRPDDYARLVFTALTGRPAAPTEPPDLPTQPAGRPATAPTRSTPPPARPTQSASRVPPSPGRPSPSGPGSAFPRSRSTP
ncbi:glycosyltransferase family 4 protein [Frankia sp. Ag45/Mut15]|uniref:Glycosyltransferase family 4 protein n=4 Tax=Frankia TaxID=1854 RepID=A0ABT0JY86_9ACTN|nr:glycosyltransferase family 4 protein [Frankia umida]MCK9876456.1 glycosyltransferase family 4 protein [Frankia umida]